MEDPAVTATFLPEGSTTHTENGVGGLASLPLAPGSLIAGFASIIALVVSLFADGLVQGGPKLGQELGQGENGLRA